jgi:hypothetical protein
VEPVRRPSEGEEFEDDLPPGVDLLFLAEGVDEWFEEFEFEIKVLLLTVERRVMLLQVSFHVM